MCLFVQHNSKWRPVSFCWRWHKIHIGDMFGLGHVIYGNCHGIGYIKNFRLVRFVHQ